MGNENHFKEQTWNQEGLKLSQIISDKLDLASSLTAGMRPCFSSARFIPRSEPRLKEGAVSELAAFSSESRSIKKKTPQKNNNCELQIESDYALLHTELPRCRLSRNSNVWMASDCFHSFSFFVHIIEITYSNGNLQFN